MPIEGAHAAARCPGALDALCLMYTMTKYTKEAMFPHAGDVDAQRVHPGRRRRDLGQPAAALRQIQYSWRASSLGIQQQI